MSFRFTPQMFEGCHDNTIEPHDLYAERANAALDAHIKTLPVVHAWGYGNVTDSDWTIDKSRKSQPEFNDMARVRHFTHTAILFNVGPFKPPSPTIILIRECPKCKSQNDLYDLRKPEELSGCHNCGLECDAKFFDRYEVVE